MSAITLTHIGGPARLIVAAVSERPVAAGATAVGLFGGTPATPGRVSFRVEWTAQGEPLAVNNPAQQYRAVVRNAVAKMEWSARTVDFDFQSAPLSTSTTDAAQLGRESNGSYY